MDEGRQYRATHSLIAFSQGLKSEEDLNIVRTALDDYMTQLDRCVDDPPKEISAALRIICDEGVAEEYAKQKAAEIVSCRKGCAHCCKQIVMVAKPEGERLFELAREMGIPLDADRLARQAEKDEAGWLELQGDDRRCAFLGADELCRIYDERPLACRKYFAVGEPERCDIERYPHGMAKIWFSLSAEILTTAAYTVFDAHSISRALLDGIQREKLIHKEGICRAEESAQSADG